MKQKEKYPFLGGVTITEIEAEEKLQPCMLKSLFDRIKNNPNVKRDVSVKAYTNSTYVDTKEQCFHTARACIYSKNDYKHPFFKQRKDNINRNKLMEEQNKFISEMTLENPNANSIVKSITVTIGRKK